MKRALVRTIPCLLGLVLGCETTQRPPTLGDVPPVDAPSAEVAVTDRPTVDVARDASDATADGSLDATADASLDATADDVANDGASDVTGDGAADGTTDAADASCGSGQNRCGGACVDLRSSPEHCGRCGAPCCAGNACVSGSCAPGCSAGLTACPMSTSSCMGGVCIDVRVDRAHCGSCDRACAAGQACVSGVCTADTPFMPFDPCLTVASYMTGSMVHFNDALRYEPSCLRVAHGAEVDFLGDFATHPITASTTRGTRPSPIPTTTSGSAIRVRFTTPGYYPFYCTFHGTDVGTGMAGVVWVE